MTTPCPGCGIVMAGPPFTVGHLEGCPEAEADERRQAAVAQPPTEFRARLARIRGDLEREEQWGTLAYPAADVRWLLGELDALATPEGQLRVHGVEWDDLVAARNALVGAQQLGLVGSDGKLLMFGRFARLCADLGEFLAAGNHWVRAGEVRAVLDEALAAARGQAATENTG